MSEPTATKPTGSLDVSPTTGKSTAVVNVRSTATTTTVPAVTPTTTSQPATATPEPERPSPPTAPGIFNAGDYPSSGVAFEIDGYELVRRVGGPTLPNSPIDSVVRSDGSILVADSGVNAVLVYDASWNLLQTIPIRAGAFDNIPLRMTLGPDDAVFVLTASDAVVKIDSTGAIDTSFNVDWQDICVGQASGIVADSAGRLIAGPTAYGQLFRFDANGDPVDVWSVDEECDGSDIAIDSHDVVYLLCRDVILTVSPDGDISTLALNELPESLSSMATLSSIAFAADDSMTLLYDGGWTANDDQDTVYHDWTLARYDSSGSLLANWNISPPGDGYYAFGTSISTDEAGSILLPITRRGRISVFDSSGTHLRSIAGDSTGTFGRVDRMTIDSAGNLYVLDIAYDRVVKLSPSGDWLAEIALPERVAYSSPGFNVKLDDMPDIAVDAYGNLLIAWGHPEHLYKLSVDGALINDWDLHPNPLAAYGSTNTIALDLSGVAFLLDTNGGGIARFDTMNGSQHKSYEVQFDRQEYSVGMDYSILDDTIYIAGSEIIPELEAVYLARRDDEDDEEPEEPEFSTVHRFDLDGRSLGRLVAFVPAVDALEWPIYVTTDSGGNVYCMTWRMTPSDPVSEPEYEGQPKSEMMLRVFDSAGVLTASGSLGVVGHAFQDVSVSPDGSLLYVTNPLNHEVLIFERGD